MTVCARTRFYVCFTVKYTIYHVLKNVQTTYTCISKEYRICPSLVCFQHRVWFNMRDGIIIVLV